MKPWLVGPALCLVVAACTGGDREAEPRTAGIGAGADSAATKEVADSLFDVAQEVYFSGEYDSALVLIGQLRQRAQEDSDLSGEARALTWIGLAHWRLGEHEEARLIGEEALAFKQQHGLTDQYFRSYNALGLLAWIENRLSDAERLYGRAIESARATDDRRAEATAHGNLALVQTELGQFANARSGFAAMQVAMADLGETRLEGNALTNLGMLEIRLGDPNSAIPLLHRALDLYQSIEYSTGTQSALGQLGTAYTALGDPGQAFVMLDSAFTLATAQGLDQEQASILEAMAELYRAAGDFPRALALYDSAKTINARLGLDLETGVDLRGEADIHVRLGDLARARAAIGEALEIHRSAGAPLEELRDLLVLAEVLDQLGETDEVQQRLTQARTLADELGARIARVEVGLSEARIGDRHRRSREVLEVIARIEPDLARGGYSAEWEARLLESRALEREGRKREAAAAGRRALATVERVRSNFGSGMLRTAFVSDKHEVYAHLVSVLLRLGEVDEAFTVADAARGRVLLERLAAAGSRDAAASASTSAFSDGEILLSEIDRLLESIDLMEETPPAERTTDQAQELGRWYHRVEQARREYEGLLVRANETDPAAAAMLGGAHADVTAVRAALDQNQLLVEYFVPPEGQVLIFAVTRDEVHAFESPVSAENLASRVRLARDLISRGEASAGRTGSVLTGLHEALVRPLIRGGMLNGTEELIIVPHHALVYLPFAALRDPTTERYLIEDFTLSILPSAAALPVLAQRPGTAGEREATSVFAPFPDQLPATRLELDAVASSGDRVQRYRGARATERNVRRALEGTGLVHVATHGIMNGRNPMFSRIELARTNGGDPTDDGRLEVHELLGLSIRAPLVFLSGCETGVGAAHSTAFVQGDDYATLAQAFLHAGAASVIATLWPVEDAGAAAFAERFYRELVGGSPPLALAAAQRAMLRDDRYSSPYYWATYQLAGYGGNAEPHTRAEGSVSPSKQISLPSLSASSPTEATGGSHG